MGRGWSGEGWVSHPGIGGSKLYVVSQLGASEAQNRGDSNARLTSGDCYRRDRGLGGLGGL